MRLLSKLLVPLEEARHGSAAGAGWVAVASGLVVAGPVAQVFLGFDGRGAVFAPVLALVAFVCTMAGTMVAMRAQSAGKATLVVLVANVLPPTLLCAPTVIGLFYATPSGLLAFAVVLPLALWARHIALDDAPHGAERMRLASALFLGGAALCLFAVAANELCALREPWGSPPQPWLLLAPCTLLSVATIIVVLSSLLPDLYRVWLRARVAAGRMGTLRLRATEGAGELLEDVVPVGAGPMRSAITHEPLGVLDASGLRVGLGFALLALGALPSLGAISFAAIF